MTRPDLARHVRCLMLGSFSFECESGGNVPPSEFAEEQHESFENIIKYICDGRDQEPFWIGKAPFKEHWILYLRQGSDDAKVALLLSLLPNLDTLYFEESYQPMITMFTVDLFNHDLYNHGHRTPRRCSADIDMEVMRNVDNAFRQLRSIRSISTSHKFGYLCPQDLVPMVAIPGLRSLEIGRANGDWSNGGEDLSLLKWPFSSGWSSIERLSLMYCAGDTYFIKKVLRAPRALKEFHFSYGWSMTFYGRQFNPKELACELQRHANTLEVLSLDFEDDYGKTGWKKPDFTRSYLGDSLRGFNKLRILKSDQQALLGLSYWEPATTGAVAGQADDWQIPPYGIPSLRECLPNSLEELTILTCDIRVMSALKRLSDARGREQTFPNLRKVHVETAATTSYELRKGVKAENTLHLPLQMSCSDVQHRRREGTKKGNGSMSVLFGDGLVLEGTEWVYC
ncbi:MAG: hypothetical protein M1820_008381 [Bogoriella megaspora]|nr:MAG: hypothetical protein M1820_008381 [Bogoriella megaspora]